MTVASGEATGEVSARVFQVSDCVLQATDADWGYATENRVAIDGHWQRETLANPNYFNGPVWLASAWSIDDQNVFRASFLRTEFQAYLYWRSKDYQPAGVWDAFGSGIVQSCDGGVLLGEQNPGNVNAGYSYPPAGFIDESDVVGDQTSIDIAASIAREIGEETGLVSSELDRQPGFWISMSGVQISIACIFKSALTSKVLKRHVTSALQSQDHPELARVHIVHSDEEVRRLKVPPYSQRLLDALM